MKGRILFCILAVGFLVGLVGCKDDSQATKYYTEEERFEWTDQIPNELVGTWVMHVAGRKRSEALRKIVINADRTVERIGGDADEPEGKYRVMKIRVSGTGRWVFYEEGPNGARKAKYVITPAGLSEAIEMPHGGWSRSSALFKDNRG